MLPQAVSKGLVNHLSQKVSYDFIIIDLVLNVFSTNKLSSHLIICDQLVISFGKRGFCLVFSNTSHVDSLYRFRKSVVDKFKLDISILMKQKHSKEDKIKIKYSNE